VVTTRSASAVSVGLFLRQIAFLDLGLLFGEFGRSRRRIRIRPRRQNRSSWRTEAISAQISIALAPRASSSSRLQMANRQRRAADVKHQRADACENPEPPDGFCR